MTSFHQFGVLAASRNEGLHPKLRDLLERAAAAPFWEVSTRPDPGWTKSGFGSRLLTGQRDAVFRESSETLRAG
jgi:hypothetical protein